ncbi:MAG: hypothetical protein AABZ06_12395 [Bdellovibrionota bacterium]
MRYKIRFLWVTDPWHLLDHKLDTTLRLAEEAVIAGMKCYWCDVRSIRLVNRKVLINACHLGINHEELHQRQAKPMVVSDFDSIQYRTDPPIDLAYLHPLQLLVLGVAGSKTQIVNPPGILFSFNEKTIGTMLGNLAPPTAVSSKAEVLLSFGRNEQKTVAKPLHKAQSKEVRLLSWTTKENQNSSLAILAKMTSNFSRPVLLQRYLDEISNGEQRLWFIDGKLLAYARKMPLKGDFRVDIDRGSRLLASTLNKKDLKAADRIGKFLRDMEIRMAAVDLVGGYVTDFNFTSPGLIRQMEEALDLNLAKPIIKSLAKLV